MREEKGIDPKCLLSEQKLSCMEFLERALGFAPPRLTKEHHPIFELNAMSYGYSYYSERKRFSEKSALFLYKIILITDRYDYEVPRELKQDFLNVLDREQYRSLPL